MDSFVPGTGPDATGCLWAQPTSATARESPRRRIAILRCLMVSSIVISFHPRSWRSSLAFAKVRAAAVRVPKPRGCEHAHDKPPRIHGRIARLQIGFPSIREAGGQAWHLQKFEQPPCVSRSLEDANMPMTSHHVSMEESLGFRSDFLPSAKLEVKPGICKSSSSRRACPEA